MYIEGHTKCISAVYIRWGDVGFIIFLHTKIMYFSFLFSNTFTLRNAPFLKIWYFDRHIGHLLIENVLKHIMDKNFDGKISVNLFSDIFFRLEFFEK